VHPLLKRLLHIPVDEQLEDQSVGLIVLLPPSITTFREFFLTNAMTRS
jgi:hypothetical protein